MKARCLTDMRSAAVLLFAALVTTSPAHAMIAVDSISSVVLAHRRELRACYVSVLASDPQRAGRVAIVMTIEPSGHVSEAHIDDDDVGSTSMSQCLVAEVRTWLFPSSDPSHGTIRITYPLRFTP